MPEDVNADPLSSAWASKAKIMVVDDHEEYLTTISQVLEWWGYEVLPLSLGKQALDLVQAESPDLIMLDYMMPEMDGAETLRRIRRQSAGASIPVIMLTASDVAAVHELVRGLGAVAVLSKADSMESLSHAIRVALDREPGGRGGFETG